MKTQTSYLKMKRILISFASKLLLSQKFSNNKQLLRMMMKIIFGIFQKDKKMKLRKWRNKTLPSNMFVLILMTLWILRWEYSWMLSKLFVKRILKPMRLLKKMSLLLFEHWMNSIMLHNGNKNLQHKRVASQLRNILIILIISWNGLFKCSSVVLKGSN